MTNICHFERIWIFVAKRYSIKIGPKKAVFIVGVSNAKIPSEM